MQHLFIILIEKHSVYNDYCEKQKCCSDKNREEAADNRFVSRAILIKVEFNRMPEHVYIFDTLLKNFSGFSHR